MIEIKDKRECCGCRACEQICPKHCISMTEDEQGFLYPHVDSSICINCHLCEKVCPVINQDEPRWPLETYSVTNPDAEICAESSSGGTFYPLAAQIIKDGGSVFGVKFGFDWEVIHAEAQTLAEVKCFMGSKYVQSNTLDTFQRTEERLRAGRKALFSGTPCQIAGLRRYLRHNYGELLLTVEVACHGVPSPAVWREYLKALRQPKAAEAKNTDFQPTLDTPQEPTIVGIKFRDKRNGWEKFGFSAHAAARQGGKNSDSQPTTELGNEEQELLFEPHRENLFMQIFLKNLDLRPSCHSCSAKAGKSGADILLADFWGIRGIHPEQFDSCGVSLVMAYTPLGVKVLNATNLPLRKADYDAAVSCNSAIVRSVPRPKQADKFWRNFHLTGLTKAPAIIASMRPSLLRRALRKLIGKIYHIFK